MFFEEIEISNILNCAHVKLHFKQKQSTVYIVQGSNNCPIRHTVSTALKFICSSQYASIESLTQFENLHAGYVRIVLLISKGVCALQTDNTNLESDSDSDAPCTSQWAQNREQRRKRRHLHNSQLLQRQQQLFHRVEALRDFRCSPELIVYTLDGGVKQKSSIDEFQRKFSTNIDFMLRQPEISRDGFTGNWLEFITTKLNGAMNREEEISKLFGYFVQLFLKNRYNECDLLSKLTTCCIIGHTALDVLLAVDALKIFNDVRMTFEFITCMEYTVWFLIPYKGRYVSVQELVMCFHLKRGVVYLQEELKNVRDYQTMQFVVTAYMQKNGNGQKFWPQKYYLQQILKACNKMGITVIIDYPGGLPVTPKDGNLIKCYKDEYNGEWKLNVEESESSCRSEQLISELQAGLQSY
ncbi:protein ORD isoform X2 [Zeugodacus cucurbitae]|uniref:protein ORD isoform X2 n=1 Tax=Zeugodacus cucurbitae TaxID=28588 RepID=UPI0023D90013|nr:protein ORD isoform X2 [Zeugodacus cucurbitae]